MGTGDITYNRGSGKLYQGGAPLLNKTFRDEIEAQEYLIKMGLKIAIKESEPSHYITKTDQVGEIHE